MTGLFPSSPGLKFEQGTIYSFPDIVNSKKHRHFLSRAMRFLYEEEEDEEKEEKRSRGERNKSLPGRTDRAPCFRRREVYGIGGGAPLRIQFSMVLISEAERQVAPEQPCGIRAVPGAIAPPGIIF
jgi:hypothetical protein